MAEACHVTLMDRATLTGSLFAAAEAGTLLTQKHDPNGPPTFDSYRSVLTHDMSASLDSFLHRGQYAVDRYEDRDYPNGLGLFVLRPQPASGFSVVGSGVPSGTLPSASGESHDVLLLVSGSSQGWHVFSTSSAGVSSMVASGRLARSGSL